jgi:hypothetical protein
MPGFLWCRLVVAILALSVSDALADVTWSLRIADTPGAASATAVAIVCVPDFFGPTAAAEATARAMREVATEFGIGPLVQPHRVTLISPHGDVPVPRRLHIGAVSTTPNGSCTRVEVLPGRWYTTQRTVAALQRACDVAMAPSACAAITTAPSLHVAAPGAGRRGWLRTDAPVAPVPHIGVVDLTGTVQGHGRAVRVRSVHRVVAPKSPTARSSVVAVVDSLSEWAHVLSVSASVAPDVFDKNAAVADAIAVVDVPLNALRFDVAPPQSVLCRWANGEPCSDLVTTATVSTAGTVSSAALRVSVHVRFALRRDAGAATWVWRCPAASPRLPAAAYPPDLNAPVLLPNVRLVIASDAADLAQTEGPGGAVYTPGPDRAVPFITACLTGLVGSWGLIRISQLFTLTSDAS